MIPQLGCWRKVDVGKKGVLEENHCSHELECSDELGCWMNVAALLHGWYEVTVLIKKVTESKAHANWVLASYIHVCPGSPGLLTQGSYFV